jgi:hypothetical protein
VFCKGGNKAKETTEKDKSSDKTGQIKGNKDWRENRPTWLTRKVKIYLQTMEKLKTRSPASDEAEEKEATWDPSYDTSSQGSLPLLLR